VSDATVLLDDARQRARLMSAARTDAMRQALARRICFDLIAALRSGVPNSSQTPPSGMTTGESVRQTRPRVTNEGEIG